MNINSEERIDWLDYAKGLAILSVVIGHVAQSLSNGTHPWRDIIVIYEMPLFFMLSGIMVNKTIGKPLLQNIRKKVSSLLIPFIMVGGIYAVFMGSFNELIFNMYHHGYWFLISLCLCWILFLFMNSIIQKVPFCGIKYYISEIIILLLPFVIYKFYGRYIPSTINESLTLNFTFTYYRFFILGHYLSRFMNLLRNGMIMGGAIMMLVLFTMLHLCNSHLLNYIPMTIIQITFAVSFLILSISYSDCGNALIKKGMCYLGRNTLSIYLFHFFFLPLIELDFLNGYSEFFNVMSVVLMAMLLSFICISLAKPIENNKYLKLYLLGKNK